MSSRGTPGLALALALCATGAAAESRFETYFEIGVDGARYTNADSLAGFELQNPSQYPFPHFSFGTDIGRYWSAELAVSYAETAILGKSLSAPGSRNRVGEYATWHVLAQMRLRYPLFDDRLVPYLIGGAGLGIGEFNDRARSFSTLPLSGDLDTSTVAAFGIGAEYFIAPNLALNLGVRRMFGFETELVLSGQRHELDLSSWVFNGGARLYFGRAPAERRADRNMRPFVTIRTGGAWFLGGADRDLAIKKQRVLLDWGGTVGLDLNPRWSIEFGGEMYETSLELAPVAQSRIAEYSTWNVLGLVRWRPWPLRTGLVPYAVAGAGWGWSNVNNPNLPFGVLPVDNSNDNGFVATLGAGVDYAIADNASLGLELRGVGGFKGDARIGPDRYSIDNTALVLSAGLRLRFR